MANTAITIAVTEQTKKAVITGDPSWGETISLTISGITKSSAANLVLIILSRVGSLMATASSFSASGDDAIGDVNLNTDELVDYFEGVKGNVKLPFVFQIYDTVAVNNVCNDDINIMNNLYTDGLPAPSPVGTEFLEKTPSGSNYQLLGGNFCIWDIGALGYKPLFFNDGTIVDTPVET